MKKYFKYMLIALGLSSTLISTSLTAQTAVDDSVFSREVSRVVAAFWNGGELNYKVAITVQEFDTVYHAPSSITFINQVNQNWFYVSGDNTEYIQNDDYRITVFAEDSILRVDKPVDIMANFLGVDVFQPGFKDENINGFSQVDSADTRKIIINFKNTSAYMKYEICFDTATYYARYINYVVKKGDYLTPPSVAQWNLIPEGYVSIAQNFSGFAPGLFSADYFLTSRYFTRQNGGIVPVAPYLNFEVINSIVE